jgi:glucose 1-dehydrogenase
MTREFSGKRALVTGSGQGIGAAIAEALAMRGCAVALHDRVGSDGLSERARMLSKAYDVEVVVLSADLADLGVAVKLFSAFDAHFPGVDILVNNAGYETTAAAEEMSEADWRGVLEVNLTAPFLLAQQAAKRMRGQGGVIVNVSSMHDTMPRKGLAHYATAKAGLAMLTKSLALEWAEYGIRVVSVAPGAIETEMNRAAIEGSGRSRFETWIPAGRLGRTADVAAAVAFLCSDAASYVTGTELVIDGGYGLNLVRYDDRPGRSESA